MLLRLERRDARLEPCVLRARQGRYQGRIAAASPRCYRVRQPPPAVEFVCRAALESEGVKSKTCFSLRHQVPALDQALGDIEMAPKKLAVRGCRAFQKSLSTLGQGLPFRRSPHPTSKSSSGSRL